ILWSAITLMVALMISGATPLIAAPFSGRATFADPRFASVWTRTDSEAVRGGRTWYWGPEPWFDSAEIYTDSPQTLRTVQYFDKARMEINNPADGIVTNGLLVVEMVSGRLQTRDTFLFDYRYSCANTPVAGNPRSANPVAPGYCQFTSRATFDDNFREPYRDPIRLKERISTTIDMNGNLGERPDLARPETTIVQYSSITGHNIPKIFWDFMNQRGRVMENGRIVTAPIVDWLFAMGYPITDPYWVRAVVGDTERDVLVQLFERRVLTYTPDNPAGYQVEMGNVGQHYFQWRYPHLGTPWAAPDPVTPLIYASNVDTGSHWELYRATFNGGGQRLTFNNGETVAFSWRRSWEPAQQYLIVDSRRNSPTYRQIYALNYIAADSGEPAPGAGVIRISYSNTDGTFPPPDNDFSTIPGSEYNAMVSPDGNLLAFVSERNGNPQLYLRRLNIPLRGFAQQITSYAEACNVETPTWSPDGRNLFWVTNCEGNFEVYRADLRYYYIDTLYAGLELVNIRNLTNNAA
ncbi:MAG: TolB family protein, partial [Chloroflexus sp.]